MDCAVSLLKFPRRSLAAFTVLLMSMAMVMSNTVKAGYGSERAGGVDRVGMHVTN